LLVKVIRSPARAEGREIDRPVELRDDF